MARDSAVYAAGIALQRGLSVLVLPAATRLLEPAELGVASAGLAVGGFLAMVLGLGFSYGVIRLYYDEAPDARHTEWAMLVRVQLVLAAALAGLAWLLGPWWSGMFEDVPWSGALQAAVVLALAQSAQSTALGVLRAARRVHAFAAVVAVQVTVGGSAALLLADRNGPGGLVAGLALGAGAGALLGIVLTYRRPAWSWPRLRAGVALSLPFVAHVLSSWVLSLSDRVLVERFLDLPDLAAYHLAYAVASAPILLTDAVQAAWLPHFYGMAGTAKRDLPRRLATPATVAVAAAAAGVVLIAPAVGALLAPSDFDFPLAVVALVVSATFVRVAYLLAFAVQSDGKESASIARASFAGAVLNVALNLWLIPVWGLTGAAVSTLIAYALMSTLLARRAGLDLAPLAGLWVVGVAVVLALTALPANAPGWAVRAALAVPLVAVARGAFRQVREADDTMVTRGG